MVDSINQNILDFCFNKSNEGIICVGKQGKIMKHNVQILKILGIKTKKIVTLNLTHLLPGLNIKQNKSIIYPLEKNGKILKIRMEILEINELDIYKLYFIQDITESIIIQENNNKLKSDILNYKQALNMTEEGVCIIDNTGKILFYNNSLQKMEGYKLEQVLNKNIIDIYKIEREKLQLLNVLDTGKPIKDNIQKFKVNGNLISIQFSAYPVFENNKIIGAISIVKDNTEYEKVIKNNIKLQEKIINKKENNIFNKNKEDNAIYKIIGEDKGFTQALYMSHKASKTDSSVLIYGETGTGKELFARAIHNESKRANEPFIPINCAAIPETLFEGILFGTTKGAYTGSENRKGLLEQANKGTLFLDEINSMPINLQVKLLRVLEERKIRKLGGREEINIDIRLISACNQLPEKLIKNGILRDDLFYRLAVFNIKIPPLRERIGDIQHISNYFIDVFNKKFNKSVEGISFELLKLFLKYKWPGNVRQLRHCIEYAMNIIENNEKILDIKHAKDMFEMFPDINNENILSYKEDNEKNIIIEKNEKKSINSCDKEIIIQAFTRNNGNISKTAREIGISRQCLQYRIKKYGLK